MRRLLAVLLALGLTVPALVQGATRPAEVRRADALALDRLVFLLAERLALSRQVAAAKWISGAPIDDPLRETAVLDEVARRAAELGVDREWAKAVFAAQFEAGKHLQRNLHGSWRNSGRGLVGPAPDLAHDVRPALDRLMPVLLQALRDAAPALKKPGAARRLLVAAEAFSAEEGLDGDVWQRALAPLPR